MNKNNLFLGGLGLVTILLIVFLFYSFSKISLDKQSISPNILALTQPVTFFSGKVEKINGNTLTVTQSVASSQPMLPPTANPSGPIPTPKITTVTYSVLVTDTTPITQPSAYMDPTTAATQKPKLTIKDIAVGQFITIYTQSDLRTLKGNSLEATMISLPAIQNSINGTIVDVKGNTLTLKAFPMFNPGETSATPPQEKNYSITLTSATTVTRPNAQGKQDQLALSDLKKDLRVLVVTNQDVSKAQSLTAVKVQLEMVLDLTTSSPAVIAPPSPTAIPTPTE